MDNNSGVALVGEVKTPWKHPLDMAMALPYQRRNYLRQIAMYMYHASGKTVQGPHYRQELKAAGSSDPSRRDLTCRAWQRLPEIPHGRSISLLPSAYSTQNLRLEQAYTAGIVPGLWQQLHLKIEVPYPTMY
ncbi:hypothetical protein VTN77DRAFT_3775 [Rasamsonia byssochlamydoides]|uniref:uncharacterized protein n=1 Tax=Rasamsonia byssochlamydoides TaxID=89139 RepID=UPI003743BD61